MFNQSDCVLCGVCRLGIEPEPPAARSEERATSERRTSEEVADRWVGRSLCLGRALSER